MKIQVDIPKELHKKLKLFKVNYDFERLTDVIIFILENKFKDENLKK